MQPLNGTFNIDGGIGADDTIRLHDLNDPTPGDNVTLTNTALTGAAPATINYLNTEIFFFEATQGADTIDVLSTQLGTQYYVTGDGGADTITIGNQTADFNTVVDGHL